MVDAANVQIFENPQFGGVRVTMSESDEPLFCAFDVAKALGYKEPKQAVTMHCKSGRLVYCPHPTTIGGTHVKFICESDVYRLIMKSELPSAEKFQDWVCDEVLPSIRKHGAYMTADTLEKALTSPDFLIQLATQLKAEQQQRIIAEAKLKDQAPKVLFANAIVAADNSILIGRLANVLKQNGVEMGQNRLFKWLRENGYLCKAGERYNQPTQVAMEKGLFEVSYNTVVRADKSIQTVTTKVTGKGQMYFVNKFLKA